MTRVFQVCRDSLGVIVPNARVEVFFASSTTQAPIFSDPALTVPMANPFICDDQGRMSFFVAPGLYRLFVERPGLPQLILEPFSVGVTGLASLEVGVRVIFTLPFLVFQAVPNVLAFNGIPPGSAAVYNQGGFVLSPSGELSVPVSGIYLFQTMVRLADPWLDGAYLRLVASNPVAPAFDPTVTPDVTAIPGDSFYHGISFVGSFSAGQAMRVQMEYSAGGGPATTTVIPDSYFMATLLQP